eukprot:15362761-Ditylum_brightwellii.AAC.1
MKWLNFRAILNSSTTLKADFDVQLQIEAILQELNMTWTMQHVKGHQIGPTLPWEAILNNRADALATGARDSLSNKHTTENIYHYPDAHIHLTINGQLITQA